MYLTTRGLILREVKYKEADKILTVLTADEGKVTAKARGVMRKGSHISAATQLLCFSELTLFGSKGRWSINEAVTLEQFRGLRDDIELLALGSYLAELLEAASDEDCPNPALLQLGLNSLYALSAGLCPQEQVKAAFELRLMCLVGYRPELSLCAVCGCAAGSGARLMPADGELLCAKCSGGDGYLLDGGTLDAMRYITESEPKRLFSFSLDDDLQEQLARVCEAYALNHLDRPFGALDYYKRLRKSK